MNPPNKRRQFIKLGMQAIIGSGLALGNDPLRSLAFANEHSYTDYSDYRALVCVYLNGGCDGFSLIVPTGSYEYQTYAHSRGDLAVNQNQVIALEGGASPVGFHTSASPLQPLYDEGQLAIIANVGTLIEPMTVDQYKSRSAEVPAQLFSHSDQTIQWQQQQARGRAESGWGAKAAHYLSHAQQRDYLTAISLGGTNYWQSSRDYRPFNLTENGVNEYRGMDAANTWQQPRANAFERMLNSSRHHVMSSAYRDLQRRALNIMGELGATLDSYATLFDDKPQPGTLGAQLAMVAQLIAAQDVLGVKRQIFYVKMGGFDVHDNQNKRHPELFRELATGLSYFQSKLNQLGKSGAVTTFTASDFGRSLLSNGDGTDHGWGNHLMVLGGAVDGGQVIGRLPSLDIHGQDSIDHGRVLPTLSATQYASTLLSWLGLSEQQLDDALPLLAGFSQRNLNFMQG